MKDWKAIATETASKRGGFCLSEESKLRSNSKILWKCSNSNHKPWSALMFNVVDRGTWCPECSGKSKDWAGLAKKHAESMGGTLIRAADKTNEHFIWKCSNPNHPEWPGLFNITVNSKSWCRLCHLDHLKAKTKNDLMEKLEQAKSYALNKNGECLTMEFKETKQKLIWKCDIEHHETWEAVFQSVVKNHTWCPECSYHFVQENRVRSMLNYLFKTSFKKQKIDDLVNPKSGRSLEFDGYSKKINMFFEYQGEQHFKSIFKSKDLSSIQYRDQLKVDYCKNKNIRLLIINAPTKNNFDELIISIKNGLSDLNLSFDFEAEKESLYKIYITSNSSEFSRSQYQKMVDIAHSYGGQILSKDYTNSNDKYEWKCKESSHPSWLATFGNVVSSKTWCKICGNNESGRKRSKKAEPSNYLGHIIRK